jgi:hypothetical protein
MTQVLKNLFIRQLFQSKDVQELIREFLFHTESTSPSKEKVHESKRIINDLFKNDNFLHQYYYPWNLQFTANPVKKVVILITSKYTRQIRNKKGVNMYIYCCERCGNYYKPHAFGNPIPKQIECSCPRPMIDAYSIRHFDMRE